MNPELINILVAAVVGVAGWYIRHKRIMMPTPAPVNPFVPGPVPSPALPVGPVPSPGGFDLSSILALLRQLLERRKAEEVEYQTAQTVLEALEPKK